MTDSRLEGIIELLNQNLDNRNLEQRQEYLKEVHRQIIYWTEEGVQEGPFYDYLISGTRSNRGLIFNIKELYEQNKMQTEIEELNSAYPSQDQDVS
ncbi:hypothetical protein HN385_00710 [archaeon]|nr:hypothetical protein [archaeon]MBT3450930.1 hypothetical protein [archaeon]MBT6869576.1 hypothetical protein [archaeon]MBT7193432.1 hypothetical protein [archaeon]MBT7381023.1 hypothetical protein [archaeon]